MRDIFEELKRSPLEDLTRRIYERAGLLPTFEDRIYELTGIDPSGRRCWLKDALAKYGIKPVEFYDPNLDKEK